MNLKSKIALGTVQFGLDYGINNSRGLVPLNEVCEILDYAYEMGIDTLDTAYAYGNSEKVLGEYTRQSGNKFKIITKLSLKDDQKIEDIFNTSLSRLSTDSIYGYLFHDFNVFKSTPKLWDKLKSFKAQKKIDKIGFSLYYTKDLDFLLDSNIDFDIIQVPYSIFDQRFNKYFDKLKSRGVKIHTRSVFLQGLVFKSPENLHQNLKKITPKLEKLYQISKSLGVSIASLCLNYSVLNENIDKTIIGVDNKRHLENNIMILDNFEKIKEQLKDLAYFAEEDENIILPFNWKLK